MANDNSSIIIHHSSFIVHHCMSGGCDAEGIETERLAADRNRSPGVGLPCGQSELSFHPLRTDAVRSRRSGGADADCARVVHRGTSAASVVSSRNSKIKNYLC